MEMEMEMGPFIECVLSTYIIVKDEVVKGISHCIIKAVGSYPYVD